MYYCSAWAQLALRRSTQQSSGNNQRVVANNTIVAPGFIVAVFHDVDRQTASGSIAAASLDISPTAAAGPVRSALSVGDYVVAAMRTKSHEGIFTSSAPVGLLFRWYNTNWVYAQNVHFSFTLKSASVAEVHNGANGSFDSKLPPETVSKDSQANAAAASDLSPSVPSQAETSPLSSPPGSPASRPGSPGLFSKIAEDPLRQFTWPPLLKLYRGGSLPVSLA